LLDKLSGFPNLDRFSMTQLPTVSRLRSMWA
jgi:hypothetical protein